MRRCLPEHEAALYVGLGTSSFRDHRKRTGFPPEVRFKDINRLVFDIRDLDAMIERAKAAANPSGGDDIADPWGGVTP
jgi:predicted DNA-binding transcriptional regulator AlpA